MRIERLTNKTREAISAAQSLAARRGNPEILPEHVLLVMLEQEGGVARPMLEKAGGELDALQRAVAQHLDGLPRLQGGSEPGLGRRTLAMLNKAEDHAKSMKDDFVSVEHVLLALLRDDKDAAALFERARVRPD